MTTGDWALTISLLSLFVALASFLWNVWSKFIYPKPKVRTTFYIAERIEPGEPESPKFLSLTAINYGPGPVTLHSAITRNFRKGFQRKRRYGFLNPIHNLSIDENQSQGPFSGGLPKKIDVGETFSAYLPFKHNALRDGRIADVGFLDTFGRKHWAPRRQVQKVIVRIREDFPKIEKERHTRTLRT